MVYGIRNYSNFKNKSDSSELHQLKECVRISHDTSLTNFTRYHEFMKFVFDTAISSDDLEKLSNLKKPQIEFNILEAMVNRLMGEFAKQEPEPHISAADGVTTDQLTPEFIKTIEVLESHLREIFYSTANDQVGIKWFKDILGGGFSVGEIYTDYCDELSFDQTIHVKRVYDPTMCGFDPLARESHKGDGEYCFQLYPKTREEFEREYGKEVTANMKFSRVVSKFSWSYQQLNQDVVLICDFYRKKKKKKRIVKLTNGHVIVKEHYEKLKALWDAHGFIEQVPQILEARWTELETIERIIFVENKILEKTDTNYRYLPLVFFDGNSVEIKDSDTGATKQMTKPFAYQAKGIQRLKNFAGQTTAQEIENMVQHKFLVAVESIPEEYKDAYKDVQLASTLVYNAFHKSNPEQPLPAPREIQRTATPPIIESVFMGSDRVTQAILGNYDAILGINSNQISGVAIQQGALQSNAAALPYLMGYVRGLNRVAQVVLDLIPKYYVTPRSLPIRKPDGKRSYQIINEPNNPSSIFMNYKANELQVKVEPGVNSSMQKQVALDQIIKMMQSSQVFAEFINSMGLETILDNLDIRGIEGLKAQGVKFMEMRAKMQEEQAEKGDPEVESAKLLAESQREVESTRIEARKFEAEAKNQVDTAKLAIEKQKADLEFLKLMAEIESGNKKQAMEEERMNSEIARDAVETAVEFSKHHQEQIMEEHGHEER